MNKFNWVAKTCGVFVLWAMAAPMLPAQSFTTIYRFTDSNFTYVYSGLVQGADGNLYGTTESGGNSNAGIVFKITPNGMLTTLYDFCSLPGCADGESPVGGSLVLATDGNFYGTTNIGGTVTSNCPYGCGTVFKITPTGSLTTLHKFAGDDGQYPQGGVIQASDGDFYGSTASGGGSQICEDYANTGCGEIFKITPTGELTTLYSFCPKGFGCPDGEFPNGVIQGSDGSFYGTTFGGSEVEGTVFKFSPGGGLTTLHTFCSLKYCTDGNKPMSALLQGSDGNFYGTTFGALTTDLGTVFKITPSGSLTTLVKFCSHHIHTCMNGESPIAPLIEATDGNFYGTTYGGRKNSSGTIFRITPSDTVQNVYRFPNRSNEFSGPRAALVQRTDGRFFGTTYGAEGYTDATIFRLNEDLSAFVRTIPASGAIGSAVNILGTNLTGASNVTFNGTAATFSVVSSSEITTTVPTGATTGTVQVVTPGGTVSSNVPFTVKP